MPVVKEVLDLNRSQTEEESSLFEGACDSHDCAFEVVHPVQAEEAKGHIILLNVLELGLDVDLFEVDLGLEMVVVLVVVDHILGNVIADDSLDLDSVLEQSLPDSGSGQSISAADIEDGKWLLFLLVLLGNGLNKVVDGLFVEIALKVIDFGVSSVKRFLLYVEFQDLINCLIKQSPVDFLRSFLVLLSVAAWVAEALQKSTKHKICYNYYNKRLHPSVKWEAVFLLNVRSLTFLQGGWARSDFAVIYTRFCYCLQFNIIFSFLESK